MLELSAISKAWPGVRALNDVSFSLLAGEIHGLVGENGAGKSTLIKIISGAEHPDSGEIALDGTTQIWRAPADAKSAGIHVIYQELALFNKLSVMENLFMNEDSVLLDWRNMERRAVATFQELGHEINPCALVDSLSVADRQMVEIARALISDTRVLILDEPTAIISGHEAEFLFEKMRLLRRQGVGIIYVSHRLNEIFSLCDRVTVLKDGHYIDTVCPDETNETNLVQLMVGRQLKDIYPPKRKNKADTLLLEVSGYRAHDNAPAVDMKLHEGEILGIGGMVGAGRTKFARTIFGVNKMQSGNLSLNGEKIKICHPKDAIKAGIGFLTEDRKSEGLIMLMDIATNISAPRLDLYEKGAFLDNIAEYDAAEAEISRFNIAARDAQASVKTLSGGNQQKVLLGRWVRANCRVLILDEPTRGVDVGAKMEIYRIMREMTNTGLAIIMISSELSELIGMSDRVMVFHKGQVAGELTGNSINEHAIVSLATGASGKAV